ncbi:MAG: T9SS type A sorting domain-containing protein [Chitinophagaceae bacterium]|nr:T9SS type A sorting domain-containing protein [Chitinophagaceae bacterium]
MYVYSKQIAHEKASAQGHAPFSREWGMTGRMVKQFSLPESETGMQIDLSNLTSGVYTYKHTQDSVLLHSGKITKE